MLVHDETIFRAILWLTNLYLQYEMSDLTDILERFQKVDPPPESETLEDFKVDVERLPPSLRDL